MGTMTGMLIGYARCSTDDQDLTAQLNGLALLGVAEKDIYADRGLTGTNRARPGLTTAMACVRAGDTLVVTKLDRLARSVRDAHDLADSITNRGAKLQIGNSVHDPNDPIGKLLFNALAMVAEFEADLIRLRTREGLAVARAKGHLRGRKPKLTPAQQVHLRKLAKAGEHSVAELMELFCVGRATVYRTLDRDAA